MNIDDDVMETARRVTMQGETLEEHARCVAEAIQKHADEAVRLGQRSLAAAEARAAELTRERDEARATAKTLALAVGSMRESHVIRAYNTAIGYPDTRPMDRGTFVPDATEDADTVDIDR